MPCRPILIVAFPFFICRLLSNSPAAVLEPVPQPFALKADAFRHYVDDVQPERQRVIRPAHPQCRGLGISQGQHSAAGLPGQRNRRDLLLPLVDLPQGHQADAGRVHHHGVPAGGWLGRQAQHDQLRRRPSPARRPLAGRPQVSRRLLALLVPQRRRARGATASGPPTRSGRAAGHRRRRLAKELLPDLVANYEAWEKTHANPTACSGRWTTRTAWKSPSAAADTGRRSTHTCTAMPWPLPASPNVRPKADLAERFRAKAAEIKRLDQEKLWDPAAQFFKVLPARRERPLSDARELHGYTPWYFDLPDRRQVVAWKQIMDPQGSTPPSARRPPSSGIRSSPSPTRATSASGTARAGPSRRPSP